MACHSAKKLMSNCSFHQWFDTFLERSVTKSTQDWRDIETQLPDV
jgi:hypothetical protein